MNAISYKFLSNSKDAFSFLSRYIHYIKLTILCVLRPTMNLINIYGFTLYQYAESFWNFISLNKHFSQVFFFLPFFGRWKQEKSGKIYSLSSRMQTRLNSWMFDDGAILWQFKWKFHHKIVSIFLSFFFFGGSLRHR